ncbi:MAG TPA: toxin-antitoxin system HicB family antitoxin [Acidimicrobiia bacterium]|jgi:predicted HicB family RNase H-like nuclease
MQLASVLDGLERSIEAQLALVASDPAMEEAGRALLGVLTPTFKEAAMSIVQQAVEEVGSQLPGHRVEVVLSEGEPSIRVTSEQSESVITDEDLVARLTLRLPPSIKEVVETAAAQSGESVNTWVVKTLSGKARVREQSGRRVSETFDI